MVTRLEIHEAAGAGSSANAPTGGRRTPSKQSLRALDIVNIFMADVRDGVGVYLSVYLLALHHWSASRIGIVIAIPALVSILAQSSAGGLIDRSTRKRQLLVVASGIIAASCVVVVLWPRF